MKKQLVSAHSLGIDIGATSVECNYSRQYAESREVKTKGTRTFKNTLKAHEQLYLWLCKQVKGCEQELVVVMEATGVYYENLAYYLNQKAEVDSLKLKLCVLLPNKAKAFAKSLGAKSKTDKADAKILAQMGIERRLEAWRAPSESERNLRLFSRAIEGLKSHSTMVMNQLHAYEHCFEAHKDVIQTYRKVLKAVQKQIADMTKKLRLIVDQDEKLKANVARLITIPGVGFTTAVSVLAETHSFEQFKSQAQLTSYAGYDVVENQSGTSVKGKARISKRGNSRLRKAMYFPALTNVKAKSGFSALFERVFERTKFKMKGYVAVQRKLLILMYTLIKKQEDFNPEWHKSDTEQDTLVLTATPQQELNLVNRSEKQNLVHLPKSVNLGWRNAPCL